jgi:hypothetical protein
VGIQRVVLENHRDVAILRRDVVDDAAIDLHLAPADRLEPRDHPEGGGLAAAGRPDEDHELAVTDLEIEVVYGWVPVAVVLRDALEDDLGHLHPLGRCRRHSTWSSVQLPSMAVRIPRT